MRRIPNHCHKCHLPVPMEDDKGMLLAIIMRSPLEAYATQCQHIRPSDTCEGSPSVSQYITGEADLRAYPDGTLMYPVDPDNIETVKKAYTELLVLAGLRKGTPCLREED